MVVTNYTLTDAGLIVVALLVIYSLWQAHRNKEVAFNLLDLVMENGRVSRIACVFLASFGVTSWVMIRMTIDGKMTEMLFAAYGAVWVAPLLTKLLSSAVPQESKT